MIVYKDGLEESDGRWKAPATKSDGRWAKAIRALYGKNALREALCRSRRWV